MLGSWSVALLGCLFLVLLGYFAVLLFAVGFLLGCYAVVLLGFCAVVLCRSINRAIKSTGIGSESCPILVTTYCLSLKANDFYPF